jgi:IS4 transposase
MPTEAQKNHQRPLVLRLITHIDGRNRRIDLLCNVLDSQLLSDAAALALYRRRWDVEVIYRSLKQTMGKRKLRDDSLRWRLRRRW